MQQVDEAAQKFAKSMMRHNLCPKVRGEERDWNFLGIWSKNRWEWTATLLACMHYNVTTVGFYDAMGAEQVEYILNQTEMTSIVCAAEYAKKIIKMKKEGMAAHITSIVLMTGESLDAET